MFFDQTAQEREFVLKDVIKALEHYYKHTSDRNTSGLFELEAVKKLAEKYDFNQPQPASKVIEDVISGLQKYAVHTPHPRYFRLFNPRSGFLGAVADYITAVFNPQLAAWSHAPFANEIEWFVIRQFGSKFNLSQLSTDGTFCTGGAESNLTALLCALNHRFPQCKEEGVAGIGKKLIVYCLQNHTIL